MVAAKVETRRYTPAEYLELERAAETKSEYIDGYIVAMSGVTRYHDRITGDTTTTLNLQLRDGPCEVFTADMRVKNEVTGRYTCPDVTVVRGEPEFEDESLDTLLNPVVIVEVLSPLTEAYDRGNKFAAYHRLPSPREYALITQDRMSIEHYPRRDDGWLLTAFTNRDAVVALPMSGCALSLSEVYCRVRLDAAPPAQTETDAHGADNEPGR